MKVLRKVSNSYSIILRETFVSLFLISRILFGDEFMFWHEAQIGHIELVFLNFQPWSSEVYSQGEKYQLFPPPPSFPSVWSQWKRWKFEDSLFHVQLQISFTSDGRFPKISFLTRNSRGTQGVPGKFQNTLVNG